MKNLSVALLLSFNLICNSARVSVRAVDKLRNAFIRRDSSRVYQVLSKKPYLSCHEYPDGKTIIQLAEEYMPRERDKLVFIQWLFFEDLKDKVMSNDLCAVKELLERNPLLVIREYLFSKSDSTCVTYTLWQLAHNNIFMRMVLRNAYVAVLNRFIAKKDEPSVCEYITKYLMGQKPDALCLLSGCDFLEETPLQAADRVGWGEMKSRLEEALKAEEEALNKQFYCNEIL